MWRNSAQTGRLKHIKQLKTALQAFVCASGAERVVVPAGAASHPPEHSGICYTPAKRREIRAELSTLVRVTCAVQAARRWVLL